MITEESRMQRGTGTRESVKNSAAPAVPDDKKQRNDALQRTVVTAGETAKDVTSEATRGNCLASLLMISNALTHGHGATSNSGCNLK